MRRHPLLLLAAVGLPLVTLAACDASDDGAGGRANVTVRLKDAPFPFESADSALVTITRVELRTDDDAVEDSLGGEGNDRVVLYDGAGFRVNLLDLRNGVDTLLAQASIPAGDYDQLRLIVAEDARVVMDDGAAYPLRIPSGSHSGIKINLPDSTFGEGGEDVELLVDFDVERSFNAQGNPGSPGGLRFSFRPVLKLERLVVDGEEVPASDLPDGGEGAEVEDDGG